jgi:hypothetical protein
MRMRLLQDLEVEEERRNKQETLKDDEEYRGKTITEIVREKKQELQDLQVLIETELADVVCTLFSPVSCAPWLILDSQTDSYISHIHCENIQQKQTFFEKIQIHGLVGESDRDRASKLVEELRDLEKVIWTGAG